MNQSITGRIKRLFDPHNKAAVAKVFRNPEYAQDTEARQVQVLFLKLLMAVAAADDEVDERELNALKSFAFEHVLTEAEWREIAFYAQARPSPEELDQIVGKLSSELRSKAQRRDLLDALVEIVESDQELHADEQRMLKALRERIQDTSAVRMWTRSLARGLGRRAPEADLDADAREYALNPAAVILRRGLEGPQASWSVPGAMLGLLFLVAHADEVIHVKEREALVEAIRDLAGLDRGRAEDLYRRLDAVPKDHFDPANLSRILVEALPIPARKTFLLRLYRLAYLDDAFDAEEDQALRLISTYLRLSHPDFIDVKVQARRERTT